MRLLAISHAPAAAGPAGAAPAPAAAAPADRVLFRVNSALLAWAIVFSRAGAYAAIVIAGTVSAVAATGRPGVVAPFAPFIIGVPVGIWHRFSSEFGTVVTTGPDGLRLRSGLVQTTAETIRPGRVQAVRLVEPLVWRAFGWYRLKVDVAGPRGRRENQPEAQRLRALIPVGSRADVEQMIGDLVSPRPELAHRAARAARRKAPLMYHFLAYAA